MHSFFGSTTCGDINALCGYDNAQCGQQADYHQIPIAYLPPPEPYWPLVFLVSGPVTRDGDGNITDVDIADVPESRYDELVSLIVKYKPMHAWCWVQAFITPGV
jgi:hypothetical protein